MDLLVKAQVLAVHITEHVGMHQAVVQRRVEDMPFCKCPTRELDGTETGIPGGADLLAHALKVPARVLRRHVGLGVGNANKGKPHLDLHHRVRRRLEAQVRPSLLAELYLFTGSDRNFVPGAECPKRMVEDGGKIDLISVGLTTKVPTA